MLSPSGQFAGKTVLLTGGLGFLGSVIVEQLLRLTEIKKVYLLTRGKKHSTAQQRVEKLLCSPLFNLLHNQVASGGPDVFSKVQAVVGDMGFPGLGLSPAETQMLKDEVEIVMHCAASLELDAQIQKTLRSNYCGTAELLQLAAKMPHLRSFVFTSTYFVNNFLPRNSVVREQLHYLPLTLGNSNPLTLGSSSSLNHAQFVQKVLSMPAAQADAEVASLMQCLNFTSTYAFGKMLTEHLVNEADLKGVSKVVVRPSLISAVAGDPYPGFINNYAGAPGFMMGYAAGFFHNITSMAYASDYILDLIPCDTVAALIIAAAAAGAAAAGPAAARGVKIYHSASAECHPLSIAVAIEESSKFWTANPPPMQLPLTHYFTYEGKHEPTALGLAVGRYITSAKIWLVCKVLEWTGRAKHATTLANGFKAMCVQNSFNYNRSIVSAVDNVRSLRDSLAPAERPKWQVLWDSSVSEWVPYGRSFLAGVRTLLFRMKSPITGPEPCNFTVKPEASPEVCAIILSSMSSLSNSGSSCSSSSSGGLSSVAEACAAPAGADSDALCEIAADKAVLLRRSSVVGKQVVDLTVTSAALELQY